MDDWPSLPPLADWRGPKTALHLTCQMVGKVRMATHPKLNHWWHVTLLPSARGLTTGRIPLEAGRDFAISLDLLHQRLVVEDCFGRCEETALEGLSVAAIHARLFESLAAIGVEARILGAPYDHAVKTPFAEDEAHVWTDARAIRRFWDALRHVAAVFERFRGRFAGKQTPVQLYWHSFDLVTTRFSGRRAPLTEGRRSDIEAYSHEVISCGFWPGDDMVPDAHVYAYAYPDPPELDAHPIRPEAARWRNEGSVMGLLPYAAIAGASNPEGDLLAFLQSAYDASAKAADWPVAALAHDYSEH